MSETSRFCGDLCPEEHLPSPSKKLNWRRSNSALLAVSVTQIGRLITQNPVAGSMSAIAMFQQLSSRFLVFIPFRLPRAPFGLDTQTAIDTLNMSKIKSSPDKKRISLKKDRRNVYGENPASSRKNI
jgi:hypothetical protein